MLFKDIINYLTRKYYLIKGTVDLKVESLNQLPKYYVDSGLELSKIITADGELKILEDFLAFIKKGDVVYDVGANIGLYTLPAALKTGNDGEVVAFEPVHFWAKRLRENLALNSIENVMVRDVGLFHRSGKKQMEVKNVLGSGMGSLSTDYEDQVQEEFTEEIEVNLVEGDEFVRESNLPLPNGIKIDVEGAELSVLKGIKNILGEKKCRVVLCEVHPNYLDASPSSLEEELNAAGFSLKKAGSRDSQYYILGYKKARVSSEVISR